MAGEFGISSDEVITILRQMDVPVRSHLTLLTDDQVARIRARWEREKRVRAEKQTAPPARRRRGTGAATPAAAAPQAPVPVEATGIRRRRRPAELAGDAGIATEDGDVDVAMPDVADVDHGVEIEHEPVAAAPPAVEPVERTAPPAEVEAMAPPPAPAAPPVAAAPPAPPRAPEVESIPAAIQPPPPARPLVPPTPPGGGGADRPRPRPIVPGAPRPRPVASGTPFIPPRPVASAAPGGGMTPRRDDRSQQQRGGGGGASGGGGGQGGGGGGQQQQQSHQQQQGRRKKGKRGAVDQEAVSANIFKTMSAMRGPGARRGGPRRADDVASREEMEAQREADRERERKTVHVNEFITVSELAEILKIPATQIVGFAFKNLGLMVTINQRLDFDQIELIAGEFGFQAVREEEYAADAGQVTEADKAEDLVSRPPIVTIMGHVDHGKTSLLDYIRKANVVAGEAGGITQHIGAYHVEVAKSRQITFLDTPGHEAFTAMRARGAQVTDIVVIVIAADDQVMPQTVEAISHAKSAGVPIIIAINKVDLPTANIPKVSQDLLQHGVVLEEFGGQVLSTPISAKKGTNINDLLDQVLLQSEILDLKANPAKNASGTVVEAQLDPGKGPVATVLVQSGTLKVGDDFIVGLYSGRVRALLDERGKTVKSAGPAIPVQVLGMA